MHTILTILHIVAGTIALLSGTTVLFMPKGTPLHRRIGRIFFTSMLVVAGTAFVLAAIGANTFLFLVGVFTLYQALTGFRAVRHRSLRKAPVDMAISLMGVTCAALMLASGHVLMLVFGGICTYLVVQDLRTWYLLWQNEPIPRSLWLQRHIGHMMGAYIAAFTAFIVVNLSEELGIYSWLTPMLVGVPLMVYWTRRYARVDRVQSTDR